MTKEQHAAQTVQLISEPHVAQRSSYRQLSTWSYEGATALLSILSFAGLIITLREFDGKPQADWTYNRLTRNTVIAALATIARTSLIAMVTISISQNKWAWFTGKARRLKDLKIFDDASRGAKGSLQLLAVTSVRQIASLGAVVVVMALAFDTFTQNVLGYEFREGPLVGNTNVTGSIARSEEYGSTYSVPTMDWFTFDVPFSMKAAISNGVLGVDSPLLPPFCLTGNCTWPIVPSLAMCGQCEDVTAQLQSNCSSEGHFCTWSLPDGVILSGPKPGSSTTDLPDAAVAVFNVSATAADVYSSRQLSDKQNGKIYAGHFSFIQTEIKEKNGGDGLVAAECNLWFCLQAYNVSIKNGIQHVQITKNWSTATPYELGTTLGDGEDITSLRNFTDITDPIIKSTFSVSYANARAISLAFKKLVEGSVSWSGNRGAWLYGSDGAQSIWESRHNLGPWIETVTSGITTAIRSNGTLVDPASSDRLYAGTATSTRSFVKVRWIWISYPALMLALGILHFLGTIWQTVQHKVHPWKANPIVPLMLGVEVEGGRVVNMDEMGRIPKNLVDDKAVLSYHKTQGWCMSIDER